MNPIRFSARAVAAGVDLNALLAGSRAMAVSVTEDPKARPTLAPRLQKANVRFLAADTKSHEG